MRPLRLAMWSGPRNLSTAMMRAWGQRADTAVVDEPLYGHYLRVSGIQHPGRNEVLEAMETDGEKVVREVVLGPCDKPVLFMKQMAHHLTELDLSFLEKTTNVLLIRDPADVLRSLVNQLPNPRIEDTGMAVQHQLLKRLQDSGQNPPVLDSQQLLLDPPGVLARLCERLGLDFDPAMLSWPAEARPEDGVWAPHWYHNVHRSTGFAPYRQKTDPVPEHLETVLGQCRPHYEALYSCALRARTAED